MIPLAATGILGSGAYAARMAAQSGPAPHSTEIVRAVLHGERDRREDGVAGIISPASWDDDETLHGGMMPHEGAAPAGGPDGLVLLPAGPPRNRIETRPGCGIPHARPGNRGPPGDLT